MGLEALIAAAIALSGIVGGFVGGKRSGRNQEVNTAQGVVTLLQAAVEELEKQNKAKDAVIVDLSARLGILEKLVTQKADVAAVEREVRGMREVVDRIADKLEA